MISKFYDLNNPLNLFLYGLTEGHSLSKQEKKNDLFCGKDSSVSHYCFEQMRHYLTFSILLFYQIKL